MRSVVKKSKQASIKTEEINESSHWQLSLLALLFVSIIFVAIKTVVYRHESRTLFMELHQLDKESDRLLAQWSRLKLEQGALLNQVSVEQQAKWDLRMQIPKPSDIRIVREMVKTKVTPIQGKSIGSKVALGD